MKQPERLLTWGLILLLLALITATIILGSVPPVDRDALTHHLFVPKLWLQHGGIHEIPEIEFSYYPMNLDLLYTIPLYFGNDIIPKYIHYLFALLTAGLIFNYLKKNLGLQYALFGALFFLSIPIIVKLSITVYVDLGLVFFTTASLLLLLHWAEKAFQWRFLILAGLCCGLAAGTKYNALVAIVILTLLVPMIYQRAAAPGQQSNLKAIGFACVFFTATLAAFSPWLIKNYLWTGNPVYPLYNSLFHKLQEVPASQQPFAEEEFIDTLQTFTQSGNTEFTARKTYYNETWWQTLLLPIRYFYQGQDDNPQFFDGKLTPFLLLLPLIGLFIRAPSSQQQREKSILLLFALLYFFLTFFQAALRIRYIVPIVPPLVILSMYGLHGTLHALTARINSSTWRKTGVLLLSTAIAGSMLWYNAQYIAGQFTVVKPLPYLRGEVSRDEYITTFRNEYPAVQYANAILQPDARVLCIFLGNRGYYMDFQPIFEQPYFNQLFARFLSAKNQDQSILDLMQQKNITHVLFRDDLTIIWYQGLNEHDRTRLAPLFANVAQPLYSGDGYTFFAVSPETEPSIP
ncbi:ArnT family glycosyltransferase [Desulfobulbus alkaliphilus]|uniref:ArnT family glycosyltransferase n=1 Tax=Desulfobulbus alkaliphilus TaxID=869814 RepID=UPI0019622ACE|nr:phospholipid carrier-dependent glycosyltransferase [Desulfobulbus alkaliphilus]MBM9538365.1 phospholipid carrier-dependent glycosyltransferase [Desulfobulbus alkaliphilus]